MRIVNRIGQALGHDIAQRRNQSSIRRIAIHNCASPPNQQNRNTASHENWWRTQASMGAPNAVGGYHELLHLDTNGNVVCEINYEPTQVSFGVGGQNQDTYNICVSGNYVNNPFDGALRAAMLERVRHNMGRFGVPIERVLGHNEFPNQSTSCPGFNMRTFRADLNAPTASNNMHRVTARTGGFMTAQDARNNRDRRTWVEVGNYHIFTSHGTGAAKMINVTTNPNVAGSWINPNTSAQTTPNTPSAPNTNAGRRVELRSVPLFASSNGNQVGTRTGAHWIWSNQVVNGRIRITNQANRVGVANQVTGWVRVSDLPN